MPHGYGDEKEKISTKAEHLTPPVITYLLRKTILYTLLLNLKLVKQLSKVYGFNLEVEISDRSAWKWSLKQKIPFYRAKVERVN